MGGGFPVISSNLESKYCFLIDFWLLSIPILVKRMTAYCAVGKGLKRPAYMLEPR